MVADKQSPCKGNCQPGRLPIRDLFYLTHIYRVAIYRLTIYLPRSSGCSIFNVDSAEAGMAKFNPELMRGSLDLMVLSVLASGPRYGYLLQQDLRDASRGLVDGHAGALY